MLLLLLLLPRRLAFVVLVPIRLAWLGLICVVRRSWCWGQSDASIDRVSFFANDLLISMIIDIASNSFLPLLRALFFLLASSVGSRDSKHTLVM